MTHRLGFWFVHVFVLAYCFVLAGGFAVQFGWDEFPCPLCITQRMAMMLCSLGGAYIIRKSLDGAVSTADFAMGWGLAIVGAVLGAAMSTRQVLLHILPDDPGYGDPVLGLHVYTWALITFVITIFAAGVNMVFAHEATPDSPPAFAWASRALLWLLGVVIAANAVVVFFEEGLHWFLPDDPKRYELIHDF